MFAGLIGRIDGRGIAGTCGIYQYAVCSTADWSLVFPRCIPMFVLFIIQMISNSAPNSLIEQTPITMGDQVVFERVFRAYHKALCYYVRSVVTNQSAAEDIVSDVFITCWKDHRTFDSEDHARFFLYRAVRNAAINHLKIVQRTVNKHESASNIYGVTEESHQEQYIRSEVLRDIYGRIELLPAQERTVLFLTLREGKKLEEVADELGLSLQTVKNYKSRAIKRLRMKHSLGDFLVLFIALSDILP